MGEHSTLPGKFCREKKECEPYSTPRGDSMVGTEMVVTPISFSGDEATLARAVLAGHPGAVRALYDRYSGSVYRSLRRLMGADPELEDLLQEAFIQALDGLAGLREPEKLGAWLTGLAMNVARSALRRRARRRLLLAWWPTPLEQPSHTVNANAGLVETYRILDMLPANERIAFALRFIEGMTVSEAAEATNTSESTFKRRLARAEQRFTKAARNHPVLKGWMEEGTRWTNAQQA